MENPASKAASMASGQDSTGVGQDRGMCEKKRTNDHPAEGGALNSGRPAPHPLEEIYLQRINDFQRKEVVAKGARESDPPIVVRDGNTDHKAKGRAEMQRGQSTHARGTNTPGKGVSSTLSALGTKAEENSEHRFRRYADDSVVCFERKDDAEEYLRELPARLAKFGLELAEEKSALVKFNWWEGESSGKFTFLGFDFYWGKSRSHPNFWRVRRNTNGKKFSPGLAKLKDWIRKKRSTPRPDLVTTLRRKVHGHWNYYGVIGNSEQTSRFAYYAKGLIFKWLNRRSQRKSFTWVSFEAAWERWQIPTPQVIEKPWPR